MRKGEVIRMVVLLAVLAGVSYAATFTDLNNAKLFGKTKDNQRAEVIDANMALLESTTASVTNAQPVTLTKTTVLTGIGGANDSTNTITLAAVSASLVGGVVVLVVDTDSTNLIAIADSGTANLSAAWEGDAEDTLSLYVLSTNEFVETSRSNN